MDLVSLKLYKIAADFNLKLIDFIKLDEGGFVTKVTIQSFMEKHIAPEAHELGHILSEECLDSLGKKRFDFKVNNVLHYAHTFHICRIKTRRQAAILRVIWGFFKLLDKLNW